MVISHNILAMNANRQFDIVGRRQAKNMEKLSSGYKINRAADDAAGLAISEKMRRLIRGLNKGIENVQDGVSLCQIADGALNEVHDMLHRLEELSVKAANGTNTESDREAIQQEVDQILSEIDRISETSTFNEQKIFSEGTASASGTAAGTGAVQSPTDTAPQKAGDFTITGGTLGTDYTFQNGVLTIISGAAITIQNTNPNVATTHRIEVAGGVNANITLAGVNIALSSSTRASALKIADNSTGNVTITIKDGTDNILTGGTHSAGLQKTGTSGSLTIEGNTGTLTAAGGDYGAGIGGGDLGSSGNITINGGIVTAQGGYLGAGIGGGGSGTIASGDRGAGSGSNITINGGTVTAKGGYKGAGIGGGGCAGNAGGNGSDITIRNAYVVVSGGTGADGIGGGNGGSNSMHGSSDIPTIENSLVVDENTGTVIGNVPIGNSGASSGSKRWWIQCGSESGVGMFIEIESIGTKTLGIYSMDVTTQEGAYIAISMISGALEKVSSVRSNIGAQQNRLEHTINNERNIVENTTVAESRIRDTDIAKEMLGLTTANILAQAGISVLAQANTSNEAVLVLLR